MDRRSRPVRGGSTITRQARPRIAARLLGPSVIGRIARGRAIAARGGIAGRAGVWLTPGRGLARRGALPQLGGVALLILVASAALVLFVQLGQQGRGTTGATLSRGTSGTPAARATSGTAETSPGLSPSPSPSATASAAPGIAGAAPTSPLRFNVRKTVVSIRFPLKANARYTYDDDFLVRRVGTPYWYNHARRTSSGTLQRAHDGVDLYVPLGTTVLSPFDGIVVDPATRWKPWIRSRYGNVTVIESTEPLSRGYVALMAHLSTVGVRVGARVQRGQVLGRTGRTGNAEATRPHLHFELRAPFLIRVKIGTLVRSVDAFDPYPSLVAADPNRRSGASAP